MSDMIASTRSAILEQPKSLARQTYPLNIETGPDWPSPQSTKAPKSSISAALSTQAEAPFNRSDEISQTAAAVSIARTTSETILTKLKDIQSLTNQVERRDIDLEAYRSGVSEKVGQIEAALAASEYRGMRLLAGEGLGPSSPEGSALLRTASPSFNLSTSAGGSLAPLKSIAQAEMADGAGAIIAPLIDIAQKASSGLRQAQERLAQDAGAPGSLAAPRPAPQDRPQAAELRADDARLQARQVQQSIILQPLGVVSQAPQALIALLT